MTSATWSLKDKGRASSWKSHTHFSWGLFTIKMAYHTKQIRRQCTYDSKPFQYISDINFRTICCEITVFTKIVIDMWLQKRLRLHCECQYFEGKQSTRYIIVCGHFWQNCWGLSHLIHVTFNLIVFNYG